MSQIKGLPVPLLLALSLPALLCAQVRLPSGEAITQPSGSPAQSLSLLSIWFTPMVDVPLGNSASIFGFGGGLTLGAEYRLPFLTSLFVSGGLGYNYDSANGVPTTLSVTSASLGSGLRFDLTPWMSAKIGVSAGYFYSFLSDSTASGGDPFLGAKLGLIFLPGPLRVTAEAYYRYLLGLEYNGLAASVGLSYELPPAKAQEGSIEFKDLAFDDIFPVFRAYYDTHPLGKVVLHNTLDEPISDIKVRFQIKQFMDDPEQCPTPTELRAGESATVKLFGLFRPDILQTTEATKVQAKVDLEYTVNGKVRHQNLVQAIRILDRNAISWTDDRRAAAFVTTKDPAVLTFSKNVDSIVKGKVNGTINPNLLTAVAFFEALHLFRLTYSQDPIPVLTSNNQVADYIQFPRQTLEYRGGKCSDLSVLYSALMESVGIETAFITVPGHIFVAFTLGLSPEEARKTFSRVDDLIFKSGKSWIPVEVTESAGFLQAWQDGASEWKENLTRGQTAFYPLHEAWQLYEPVALPGKEAVVDLPPSEEIVKAYQDEIARFVAQTTSPKAAAIQEQMKKARDRSKLTNELGVLYAKNGLYDKAKQEFEKLLSEEYVPALLNLGNIYYLTDQKEKALDYYHRAYSKDPQNALAVLGMARTLRDLGRRDVAEDFYLALKGLDPSLAQQFSYLTPSSKTATRSTENSESARVMIWDE